MLIRGLYFEGWDPTHVPVKGDREEFLNHIAKEFPYDVKGGMERLVQTVIHPLRRHVTEGEWQDIKAGMSRDLASILP
jgi:uncharacterized protein (DUF2267 family)